MVEKRRRGRQPTFNEDERRTLAAFILRHGIRETRAVCGISISCGTLLRIAREFGIVLKKGKRPRRAA